MRAASLSAKRSWMADDDDSLYFSLPYGTPSPGQFGGPPALGGSLGSRSGSSNLSPQQERGSPSLGVPIFSGAALTTARNPGNLLHLHAIHLSLAEDNYIAGNPASAEIQGQSRTGFNQSEGEINRTSRRGDRATTQRDMNSLQVVPKVNQKQEPASGTELLRQVLIKAQSRDGDCLRMSRLGPQECRLGPRSVTFDDRLAGAATDQERMTRIEGQEGNASAEELVTGINRSAAYNGDLEENERFLNHSEAVNIPPPPLSPRLQSTNKNRLKTLEILCSQTRLNEAQCREAVVKFASRRCCYGTRCAKEHQVKEIIALTSYRYTLETFCERRAIRRVFEPYRSGEVDGSDAGETPNVWKIPVLPTELFVDQTKAVPIPRTAFVKACSSCHGDGVTNCAGCHGVGHVSCRSCDGQGKRIMTSRENGVGGGGGNGTDKLRACYFCGGNGQRRCDTCGLKGHVTCSTCDGLRQLKYYDELIATFKNHFVESVIPSTSIPDDDLPSADEILIFQESSAQLSPVTPDTYLPQEIARLLEEHRRLFATERSIQQRHRLYVQPITEVHYTWRSRVGRYWVYGAGNRVHFPDYPTQLCCTIQ